MPSEVDLEIMVRLAFAALLGALIGAEGQAGHFVLLADEELVAVKGETARRGHFVGDDD